MVVEIEIPVLMKNYDFEIDEKVPLGTVVAEVVDVLCRKEQCKVAGNPASVTIWLKNTGERLRLNRTAAEYGIGNGSALLII